MPISYPYVFYSTIKMLRPEAGAGGGFSGRLESDVSELLLWLWRCWFWRGGIITHIQTSLQLHRVAYAQEYFMQTGLEHNIG